MFPGERGNVVWACRLVRAEELSGVEPEKAGRSERSPCSSRVVNKFVQMEVHLTEQVQSGLEGFLSRWPDSGCEGGECAVCQAGQIFRGEFDFEAAPSRADEDGRMIPGGGVDECSQPLFLPQRADAAQHIARGAFGLE